MADPLLVPKTTNQRKSRGRHLRVAKTRKREVKLDHLDKNRHVISHIKCVLDEEGNIIRVLMVGKTLLLFLRNEFPRCLF